LFIVFPEALPIHLFKHFCCRMYRTATIHSVTDSRSDRQTTLSCQHPCSIRSAKNALSKTWRNSC